MAKRKTSVPSSPPAAAAPSKKAAPKSPKPSVARAPAGKAAEPKATASQAPSKAPAYLKKMHVAVRSQFAEANDLPTFLSTAGTLTVDEQIVIVQQALVLVEQNYAHLPLKRAMHSVDPVQRLKLVLQKLQQPAQNTAQRTAAEPISEAEFHRQMTDIFTSVRDLHTNYLLPDPYNRATAFLPFMVEDFFEDGRRRYLVSHVTAGFEHATFQAGVELVHWNGMPIERAVMKHAERYAGSNREARHARGVQTLTTRVLAIAAPPDEQWVVVGYRTAAGRLEEFRIDWMVSVLSPDDEADEVDADDDGRRGEASAGLGLDLEQQLVQTLRKSLFAPQVVAEEKRAAARGAGASAGGSTSSLQSRLPGIFQARTVMTPSGTFGHLRIRSFQHWPAREFVEEFLRLVALLPQNGLILDVRGNGGGLIANGELLLQTLTAKRIEPEPLQWLGTPLNLEICRRHGPDSRWTDLSPWVESLEQAFQTGAAFSAGFPITDRESCNALGQKYFGPVVLVTDALCYSTTDIFAAGFQDHEIGPVLGVADNTGAGGANVWTHRDLAAFVLPGADSVYRPLPRGAGMRVAVRRSLRVGRRAGAPVEDLGVLPDKRHFMTRADLLRDNVDLMATAGSLLAQMPQRNLSVVLKPTTDLQATVVTRTLRIDRLDAYLNDRPIQSIDLREGRTTFVVSKPDDAPHVLEIHGFDQGRLVARHRTTF